MTRSITIILIPFLAAVLSAAASAQQQMPAAMAEATDPPPMMTLAMMTAEKTMMLPMERSMPPEISRSDMPMVRIPTTETCWSTTMTLPREMKRGFIDETTTQSNRMMIHRSTR